MYCVKINVDRVPWQIEDKREPEELMDYGIYRRGTEMVNREELLDYALYRRSAAGEKREPEE